MGNTFDPRCDRHTTAIFQPGTSAARAVKLALYEMIQRFELANERAPYAVEMGAMSTDALVRDAEAAVAIQAPKIDAAALTREG